MHYILECDYTYVTAPAHTHSPPTLMSSNYLSGLCGRVLCLIDSSLTILLMWLYLLEIGDIM